MQENASRGAAAGDTGLALNDRVFTDEMQTQEHSLPRRHMKIDNSAHFVLHRSIPSDRVRRLNDTIIETFHLVTLSATTTTTKMQ